MIPKKRDLMASRTFRARVRIAAGKSREVTVTADSQAAAKAKIEANYGRGSVQAWLPS